MLALQSLSFPDLQEPHNDNSRAVTTALAARFRQVSSATREADPKTAWLINKAATRLFSCARAGELGTGRYCGAAYCPRCACQRAKKNQRELVRDMRRRVAIGKAPFGFGLLTLTVAAAEPAEGIRLLGRAKGMLARKRAFSRALIGGRGQVYVEPGRGSDVGDAWNVHLHAVVELGSPFRQTDVGGLAIAWGRTLEFLKASGKLDLQQCDNLRAKYLRDEPT